MRYTQQTATQADRQTTRPTGRESGRVTYNPIKPEYDLYTSIPIKLQNYCLKMQILAQINDDRHHCTSVIQTRPS